jgi:hypothetical protein
MPFDSHNQGKHAAMAAGALLVLAALCCALPLLITAGLAGLGSILGNPWVIGAAVALLVGGVLWRVARRTGTSTTDRDQGCCSPAPGRDQSRPKTGSPTPLRARRPIRWIRRN